MTVSGVLVRDDRAAACIPALDSMVVGPWNRLAHAAGKRFAETRGAWTRTLLVTGGEGQGKSHLLSAIAAALREAPGRRPAVTQVTCDDFTRQFTWAATHNRMAAFRQKFRTSDILLFDDADRLEGRTATQEEVLHLLDQMETSGRSVVMTSRARAREFRGLSRPLTTRVVAAMQVRIEPPDPEGRRHLLQWAALRERRPLAADVAEAAARGEGCVRNVLSRWERLREVPVLTAEVAGVLAAGPGRVGPTLEGILASVAEMYGVKGSEIRGGGRSRRVAVPRHVTMLLAKRLCGASLAAIARWFGGRNHATVLYACRRMESAMKQDLILRGRFERLERAIKEGP